MIVQGAGKPAGEGSSAVSRGSSTPGVSGRQAGLKSPSADRASLPGPLSDQACSFKGAGKPCGARATHRCGDCWDLICPDHSAKKFHYWVRAL